MFTFRAMFRLMFTVLLGGLAPVFPFAFEFVFAFEVVGVGVVGKAVDDVVFVLLLACC